MSILPLSFLKRPRGRHPQQNKQETKPLLYAFQILGVVETTAWSTDDNSEASCITLHCCCRSNEALYCASWPANQENFDPTLVSVTVQPQDKHSANLSQCQLVQPTLRHARPTQRAPSPQPSLEHILQAKRRQVGSLESLDTFVPSHAYHGQKPSSAQPLPSEDKLHIAAPADTPSPVSKNAVASSVIHRPSLYGNTWRLTDVADCTKEDPLETPVTNLPALQQANIARLTPPDSQSPSPQKEVATLHQPKPHSHSSAAFLRGKGEGQAPPPSPPLEHKGSVSAIALDAEEKEKDEDANEEDVVPELPLLPPYNIHPKQMQTQYTPNMSAKVYEGKGRTSEAIVHEVARAPPPPQRPGHKVLVIQQSQAQDEGIPQAPSPNPPPGFTTFTIKNPSQPLLPPATSKVDKGKGRASEPFQYEEAEAPLSSPRPVQRVPLYLQWQGYEEDIPQRSPPLPLPPHNIVVKPAEAKCTSGTQPKLDKGKGREFDLLRDEETQASTPSPRPGHRVSPLQLWQTFKDNTAQAPPLSPRPRFKTLTIKKPFQPLFPLETSKVDKGKCRAIDRYYDDDEEDEGIAQGPPPSPRPKLRTLVVKPALAQSQIDALIAFNSGPSGFSIPYSDSIKSNDSEETDDQKRVVDRGQLLMHIIQNEFQVPPDIYNVPGPYAGLAPRERAEKLYHDNCEVDKYVAIFRRAQNFTEEEIDHDPLYLRVASAGTIDLKKRADRYDIHHAIRKGNRNCDEELVKTIGKLTRRYPRRYTAFERKLQEEDKSRASEVKDSGRFCGPLTPLRWLRGSTPEPEGVRREQRREQKERVEQLAAAQELAALFQSPRHTEPESSEQDTFPEFDAIRAARGLSPRHYTSHLSVPGASVPRDLSRFPLRENDPGDLLPEAAFGPGLDPRHFEEFLHIHEKCPVPNIVVTLPLPERKEVDDKVLDGKVEEEDEKSSSGDALEDDEEDNRKWDEAFKELRSMLPDD